jgi:hypothetical protein
MRVTIEGIQQGSIEVELTVIPRVGEFLRVMYGPDAELKCEVTEVKHYINQHNNEQKIILTVTPTFKY